MSDPLPTPATAQDMYAYATVVELRRLNANLEALGQTLQSALAPLPEADGETVQLKEPETEPEPPKKASNRDAKKKAAAKDK